MTRIRINVTVTPDFTMEELEEQVLMSVQEHMDSVVAPHFVEVAKARAPVGKREIPAGFNKTSFQRIVPRLASEFTNKSDRLRATALSGLSGTERVQRFRAALGGSTSDPDQTRFFRGIKGNRGRSPDRIELRNNTIKGAFTSTRTPGRLRDSIVYRGSTRVGRMVVGEFAATAEHAAAVHDGFTHQGGRDHSGASKQIAGRPFFDWATANIDDDFQPIKFEG
jgi:hypothetical protein